MSYMARTDVLQWYRYKESAQILWFKPWDLRTLL